MIRKFYTIISRLHVMFHRGAHDHTSDTRLNGELVCNTIHMLAEQGTLT